MNQLLKALRNWNLTVRPLADDLDQSWEVLAEAIQTVMRKYDIPEPYEKLKALTRGNQQINQAVLNEFIDTLDLPEAEKSTLKSLSPASYIGLAQELAKEAS